MAQQVLALDPNNSEAWRIIGYANEIMQQFVAARDAYAIAVQFDAPSTPTTPQSES